MSRLTGFGPVPDPKRSSLVPQTFIRQEAGSIPTTTRRRSPGFYANVKHAHPTGVPPSGYQVTVLSAVQVSLAGNVTINALLTFDRMIPNADGHLVLSLRDGRNVTFSVDYISPNEKGYNKGGAKEGEPIDHLLSQWDPVDKHVTPENLKNAKGVFFADDFTPNATNSVATSRNEVGASVVDFCHLDRLNGSQFLSSRRPSAEEFVATNSTISRSDDPHREPRWSACSGSRCLRHRSGHRQLPNKDAVGVHGKESGVVARPGRGGNHAAENG